MLFLFTTIGFSCFGQVTVEKTKIVDTTILATVAKIETINAVSEECLSIDCTIPQQWYNFIELKNSCNESQLLYLTDYKNPTVKTYAFWALLEMGSSQIAQTLNSHRNDLDTLKYFSACTSEKVNLIDLWTVKANSYYKSKMKKEDKKELKKITDLIVAERKKKSKLIDRYF
jgi:hypothetical protein